MADVARSSAPRMKWQSHGETPTLAKRLPLHRSAMQEDRTLGNRWWFAVPTLTLLLLAPTLFHGQPFLYWDTGQYYHYGAQLVGFATTRIGTIMQLNALGPSEIAKEQGPGNLDEAGGRAATTAVNSFDNTIIAQKSQAGGMATYGIRSPFYSMWLYSVASAFTLWGVLIAQAAAVAWIIWRVGIQAARACPFRVGLAIIALS